MVVAVAPAEPVLPALVAVLALGLDRPAVTPPLDQALPVDRVAARVVVQLQVMLMHQVLESALALALEEDKPAPVQALPRVMVAAPAAAVVAARTVGLAAVEAAVPVPVTVGSIETPWLELGAS